MRGRFVRGVDAGAGRDPDVESRSGGHQQTKLGSVQEDGMQAHKHEDPGHTHRTATHRYRDAAGLDPDTQRDGNELTNWNRMEPVSEQRRRGKANLGEPVQSSAGNVRYGQETRPKNIYVNWIIKARDV